MGLIGGIGINAGLSGLDLGAARVGGLTALLLGVLGRLILHVLVPALVGGLVLSGLVLVAFSVRHVYFSFAGGTRT